MVMNLWAPKNAGIIINGLTVSFSRKSLAAGNSTGKNS
jgi:hypothetical protein